MARLGRREMEREVQPGHKILLNSQLANIEGMSHVFRVHQQMNFAVYGNGHLRGDDVISRFHVIRGIQAEIVLISFIDFVWMKRAKLPVRSGISEIKCKLASLRLDLQGRPVWAP